MSQTPSLVLVNSTHAHEAMISLHIHCRGVLFLFKASGRDATVRSVGVDNGVPG